ESEARGVDLPAQRIAPAMHRGGDARCRTRGLGTGWGRSSCDEERWIHCRIERRRRFGPVLEGDYVRAIADQAAHAAAGERSPELRREEERHRPTRTQEGERTLGEQCGHVHLRGEARTG